MKEIMKKNRMKTKRWSMIIGNTKQKGKEKERKKEKRKKKDKEHREKYKSQKKYKGTLWGKLSYWKNKKYKTEKRKTEESEPETEEKKVNFFQTFTFSTACLRRNRVTERIKEMQNCKDQNSRKRTENRIKEGEFFSQLHFPLLISGKVIALK